MLYFRKNESIKKSQRSKKELNELLLDENSFDF